MASSRSCLPVIRSPVSASSASMNMERRSPRSPPCSRRSAMMWATRPSRTRIARSNRMFEGVGRDGRKNSFWNLAFVTSSAVPRAEETSPADEARSRPIMVRPITRSVSRLIASETPIPSPSRHMPISCRTASVIVSAIAASRVRWNAGWAGFRCRRQNSPSLVSRPSPTIGLMRTVSRAFG